MPVAAETLANHFALQYFQRCEQTRRAVTLVIMGHRPQASLLHRQSGLRAIQRLIERVQVQAHHIGELLQKAGIARELEALDAVVAFSIIVQGLTCRPLLRQACHADAPQEADADREFVARS